MLMIQASCSFTVQRLTSSDRTKVKKVIQERVVPSSKLMQRQFVE
jgi:hypothetical protein